MGNQVVGYICDHMYCQLQQNCKRREFLSRYPNIYSISHLLQSATRRWVPVRSSHPVGTARQSRGLAYFSIFYYLCSCPSRSVTSVTQYGYPSGPQSLIRVPCCSLSESGFVWLDGHLRLSIDRTSGQILQLETAYSAFDRRSMPYGSALLR